MNLKRNVNSQNIHCLIMLGDVFFLKQSVKNSSYNEYLRFNLFRYFCETLLDFYDPCPVKEELRLKIVGRLIKEGSNADEPANIALSDYSSLR